MVISYGCSIIYVSNWQIIFCKCKDIFIMMLFIEKLGWNRKLPDSWTYGIYPFSGFFPPSWHTPMRLNCSRLPLDVSEWCQCPVIYLKWVKWQMTAVAWMDGLCFSHTHIAFVWLGFVLLCCAVPSRFLALFIFSFNFFQLSTSCIWWDKVVIKKSFKLLTMCFNNANPFTREACI